MALNPLLGRLAGGGSHVCMSFSDLIIFGNWVTISVERAAAFWKPGFHKNTSSRCRAGMLHLIYLMGTVPWREPHLRAEGGIAWALVLLLLDTMVQGNRMDVGVLAVLVRAAPLPCPPAPQCCAGCCG